MINKVVMTKGAVFDYEEIVCLIPADRQKIKSAAEKSVKEENAAFLRTVYADPDSQKELILFLRRGYDFGPMRTWILEGICEKCDYSPEMEENGIIKEWLEVVIE